FPYGTTGGEYKHGGYVVSASNEGLAPGFLAWMAFDAYGTANNSWSPGEVYTGGSPGTYPGLARLPGIDTSSATIPLGEWLKLQLPCKLVVSYLRFNSRGTGQSPKDFKIYGSNDDYNWDLLLTGVGTGANPNVNLTDSLRGDEFAVNATKGYKYLAMSIQTVVGSNGSYLHVADLQFYGHKEGDLTRFPEPTRVLKYPHVVMTGPAQRGYVVSTDANNPDTTHAVWNIVDGEFNDRWQAPTGTYPNNGTDTTGGSTTTLADTTTKKGQYLQIESPHKLIVTKYKIFSNTGVASYRPKKVILLGSNTGGTDWVSIDPAGEVLPTYSGSDPSYHATVSFSNTSAYKYHRLVIRALDSNQLPIVYEWELYGTEEDTGTPAIVGGPFAGKVANFRVYDQYLGDERIQEIYDAQKDEFGHKKSSMTLYKGRVGVGTTEPEGALTVLDERHALAKFPARAVSANDSYVEGDGRIQLSAAHGTGYSAFDGLTSTSWAATPTRNTLVSEEVDFGAWLKIQTPESVSLKKAEIES
ncbi:MAG: hypothetical protein ACKVHS_09285, partial [Flavobacteriales bacterium]